MTAATGAKNQTRVSNWWRCISLFAHVFSVKQSYIPEHENWNKTNALINVPKKETHPESDDFKSNQWRESTCLPLFALLVTHKEKRQSCMPVNLKKTEFTPASVQAGSSSCTFHPEVTSAGGNWKTIPVEKQTPTFTLVYKSVLTFSYD